MSITLFYHFVNWEWVVQLLSEKKLAKYGIHRIKIGLPVDNLVSAIPSCYVRSHQRKYRASFLEEANHHKVVNTFPYWINRSPLIWQWLLKKSEIDHDSQPHFISWNYRLCSLMTWIQPTPPLLRDVSRDEKKGGAVLSRSQDLFSQEDLLLSFLE